MRVNGWGLERDEEGSRKSRKRSALNRSIKECGLLCGEGER